MMNPNILDVLIAIMMMMRKEENYWKKNMKEGKGKKKERTDNG